MQKELIDILVKQHYKIDIASNTKIEFHTSNYKSLNQLLLLVVLTLFFSLIFVLLFKNIFSVFPFLALVYLTYNYHAYFTHGIFCDRKISISKPQKLIEIEYSLSGYRLYRTSKIIVETSRIISKKSIVASGINFSPYTREFYITFYLKNGLICYPLISFSSTNEDKVNDYRFKFEHFFKDLIGGF